MKRHATHRRAHSCVMVYPSGEREPMPRYTDQISIWLRSNKTFHPSAALFVDGQCRYKGHLSDDEIQRLEGELA